MKTDKIDFLSVGGELSTTQKEIAISIWKRVGCFDTVSDDAHTVSRFREEKIIDRTFYNYDLTKDYDKLVRLLEQIISYYRFQFTNSAGVNEIARLYYARGKKGKNSYVLICKPNKAERVKGWAFRLNSAATNIDRADKIQKDDVVTIPENSFTSVINKVCAKRPLEERPQLLKEFIAAAQEKLIEVSTTLALIESSKKLEDAIDKGEDKNEQTKKDNK